MGLHYFNRWEFERVLKYLNQAIIMGQNFAREYAAVAEMHWLPVFGKENINLEENSNKAKTAVEKALSIDNKHAKAYVSLALLNVWYEWDWSAAERNLKRADELNPNSSKMYHG